MRLLSRINRNIIWNLRTLRSAIAIHAARNVLYGKAQFWHKVFGGNSMIDLSVVFGTYNRLDLLQQCYLSILKSTRTINTEILIINSDDFGKPSWALENCDDVWMIWNDKNRGCVDAYNSGFYKTSGKYVAFLNDDITVENDALVKSVEMLDKSPDIGMVAIPYENPGRPRQVAYCNAGNPSKRYLFACFGVLRRELGERAGWFDGFYHYCGDLHLAMSIWKMGYRVEELRTGGYIKHFDAPSPVKNNDPSVKGRIKNDWKLYAEKWGNWNHVIDSINEKDYVENNFQPADEMPEE
jgi:GT2 family glycosyltransferase